MPISLQKGQKVSLTKDRPGLSKVVVGLGWDVNQFDTGGDFDLDTANESVLYQSFHLQYEYRNYLLVQNSDFYSLHQKYYGRAWLGCKCI